MRGRRHTKQIGSTQLINPNFNKMAENPSKKLCPNTSGPPPVFSSISEFSRGSQTNEKRYKSLAAAFKSKYGAAPQFIARAPGRVNLIGEHVDYSGYAVLPMAIEQDVAIACSPRDAPIINIANVDSVKYEDRQHPLKDIVIEGREWCNYVLCGVRGMKEYLSLDALIGMDMLVDGNIPPGSGLSSSSALVCCSALATAFANGIHSSIALPSKTSFAELTAKCERYIGTEGGGMDQAISFLGEQGKAMMIEFDPVRPTEVEIPEGHVFVIANTLVEAEKASSESQFNVRVVECRLASILIARSKGMENFRNVRKLGQVQDGLELPLSQMEEAVINALHSDPYSRADLCTILGISDESFQTQFLNQRTNLVKQFQLYERAKHVYLEARRVYEFKEITESESCPKTAEKLGTLMDQSHWSLKELYECSCPELDEVVALAKLGGSLGARLTGAGWGGCVVSLVPEDKQGEVIKTITDGYFKKSPKKMANLEDSLFVTKPGPGAAVCDLRPSL